MRCVKPNRSCSLISATWFNAASAHARHSEAHWLHLFALRPHPRANYIKVIMDGIFGHENFKNEIVWKHNTSHNSGSQFGRIHDIISFFIRAAKIGCEIRLAQQDILKPKFHDSRKTRKDASTKETIWLPHALIAIPVNSTGEIPSRDLHADGFI